MKALDERQPMEEKEVKSGLPLNSRILSDSATYTTTQRHDRVSIIVTATRSVGVTIIPTPSDRGAAIVGAPLGASCAAAWNVSASIGHITSVIGCMHAPGGSAGV